MGPAAMPPAISARDEELALIDAFLDRPEGPMALVLVGDAGIGKSTLWLAGIAAARSRGRVVLVLTPDAGRAGPRARRGRRPVRRRRQPRAAGAATAPPPCARAGTPDRGRAGRSDRPSDARRRDPFRPRAPRPRRPAPAGDRRRPVGRQLVGRGRRVRPPAVNRRRCPAVAGAALPRRDGVDEAGGCAGSVGDRAPDRRATRRGRHRVAAPAAPGSTLPRPTVRRAPRGLGWAIRSTR